MKKITPLSFILITIMLSACTTSLHPLASYNTAVTDSRLAGSWRSDGHDYTVQKFFGSDLHRKIEKSTFSLFPFKLKEKQDSILCSKSYSIKYTNENIEYYLFGTMVKLNGQYFITFTGVDIKTIDSISQNVSDSISQNFEEPNLNDFIMTHTIARIKFIDPNTINLNFIDGGFIYDQIKTGRMKLKHESDDLYDTFLITASTNELQQFIQKYGNDDRFFNKENSVTLIRKS